VEALWSFWRNTGLSCSPARRSFIEEIGRKAAQLGMRILGGEDAQAAARSESHQVAPIFDWRELRRWNISAQRLPPGSMIRFKEATYWEQHHKLILWTVSLCAVEAFLIGALLVQLRRRRLAERSLRESEERMSLAAEATNLGMWVWDVVRDKIWMTDKGRALFGFAPDTRLDRATLISRVHPEDRAARDLAIRRAIETQGEYAMEYRVLLPDGTLRWIGALGHGINVGDAKGARLLGVSMDVTAQKEAEAEARQHREEIAHLSRVAILGEMAGSLAHELNQPLGAILANAGAGLRFLERDRLSGEKLRELLQDIAADGRRASDVIRTVKGMGRKEEGPRQLLDLNDVIADALRRARTRLHSIDRASSGTVKDRS
jgi:PAS domain S-box-containing protein